MPSNKREVTTIQKQTCSGQVPIIWPDQQLPGLSILSYMAIEQMGDPKASWEVANTSDLMCGVLQDALE